MNKNTNHEKLKWNLVTKNVSANATFRKSMRRRISELEEHISHLPTDGVHLHISLKRQPKTNLGSAALHLRVPSNILRSEGTDSDVNKAFDDAISAMLGKLDSHRTELNRKTFWRQRDQGNHERERPEFTSEPQRNGAGPQNLGEVARDLLEQHLGRLTRYVRRHLWHDTTAGDLPPNAIDPISVVDEVARQVLLKPEAKPSGMSYLVWFFFLARQELAQQRKSFEQQALETVPLEEDRVILDDLELVDGYDAEQPLDIIELELEPPIAETRDILPDDRIQTPDKVAERSELLAQMRRMASSWPRQERAVFELHFVEGLEPEEMGKVLNHSTE